MTKAKTGRRTATATDGAFKALVQTATVTDSDVARRAYTLYLARNREHGHDVDDWLQAERDLQAPLASRLNQLADDGCPNFP